MHESSCMRCSISKMHDEWVRHILEWKVWWIGWTHWRSWIWEQHRMTTADRCTLLIMTESIQCFIESLAQNVIILTRHHHLLKCKPSIWDNWRKSSYFRVHHCGRLLLCSSGCSSRVSLGKHTGNIAPICCVLQKRIGSLGVDSHCMISDTTQHTTSTVYAYQKTLLDGLKVKHSAITKVHYFSDGCTGQY